MTKPVGLIYTLYQVMQWYSEWW